VLKAVLFDLDGTLLDIDLDGFLREYFSALGPAISEVVGNRLSVQQGLSAVIEGTNAMSRHHGSLTNREVFETRFLELTGADLASPVASARIERFYRDEFPALRGTHCPRAGGIDAVRAAREEGLVVALATNPIFPLAAIRERMRWASLDESWFDVITSYEVMHACKPMKGYFEQTAHMLGVEPTECLMVGDDATLDMPASSAGMRTYYVGEGLPDTCDGHGDLSALVEFLHKALRSG